MGQSGIVLWNPGSHWAPTADYLKPFTGITGDVSEQVSVDPSRRGTTAVQVVGSEIGIYIDSTSLAAGMPTVNNLGTVVLAHNMLPNGGLGLGRSFRYSFDLKVPFADVRNGGVAQVVAYFCFTDRVHRQSFWYGMNLFDSRGLWYRFRNGFKSVMWDGGTNLPIAHVSAGFDWVRPGSTAFFTGRPFGDYRSYTFVAGPAQINAAVTRIIAKYPAMASRLSTNSADYDLGNVNLNPEVAALPGAYAGIGMAVRNWKVEPV